MKEGAPSYGVVNSNDVLNITPRLGAKANDLETLIAQNLLAAADMAKTHKPTLKFSKLQLLPIIPNPGQIFRIGLTCGEHVLETCGEVRSEPS